MNAAVRLLFALPVLLLLATSCDDDSPAPDLHVPATYVFERDGQSTVSYSGQIERLDHLAAMKALMVTADAGSAIDGEDLLDMFRNTGGNGNGQFGFTSTKKISDKTAEGERLILEGLMDDMGTASLAGANGDIATSGAPGLLERSNGSKILVDADGHEFTQRIEKGIMGATFYYQIASVYLTDARVGDGVNNTDLVDGENYTAMEHHWDEAFGYLGVPVDFRSNWPAERNSECRFLGNYIRGRDALLGSSDILMEAFRTGRAAIVAGAYDVRDEQRDIIYTELERVIAGTAIHYINEALASTGETGDFHHVMSEAYTFIRALQFSPRATLSNTELTGLLEAISDADHNFWNATQSGLQNARDALATAFGLTGVAESL